MTLLDEFLQRRCLGGDDNTAVAAERSTRALPYRVVPTEKAYIPAMMRVMRKADKADARKYGINLRQTLFRAVGRSRCSRTALVDGSPVAMWGITPMIGADGAEIANMAFVWVVIADQLTRFPLAIVKETRRQLSHLAQGYAWLTTSAFPWDDASLRFVTYLGFKGRLEGPDMHRKDWVAHLKQSTVVRCPVGKTYAIIVTRKEIS